MKGERGVGRKFRVRGWGSNKTRASTQGKNDGKQERTIGSVDERGP